jgi:hypothetical protein
MTAGFSISLNLHLHGVKSNARGKVLLVEFITLLLFVLQEQLGE